MERTWNEVAAAQIELLIQPLSLGTEKNHKKIQEPGELVSRSTFQPMPCQIQSRSDIHLF
jgi:hypothetical protein